MSSESAPGPPPNFADIAAAVKSATPEQLEQIESMLAGKTGMSGRTMGASMGIEEENDPGTAVRKLPEAERSAFASRLLSSSDALLRSARMKVEQHKTSRAVISAFAQCPHGLSIPRGLIAKFLEKLPQLRPDEAKRVVWMGGRVCAHVQLFAYSTGNFPAWSASYSEDLRCIL